MQSYFFLTSDTVSFHARLITRDYPKYQMVIPEKSKNVFTINTEKFKDYLKRFKITTEKKKPLKIQFDIEKLTFINETMKAELFNFNNIAESMTIGFNINYLLDAVKHIDSEKIIIKYNSELAPCVIQSSTGNCFNIVMPMKI